jgi:threonine dehydrogenase-like Zn-dependent dehydrogenase
LDPAHRDVAIEALGTQDTFAGALRVLRPGGTLSSLGVYSSDLTIPLDAFGAGLADLKSTPIASRPSCTARAASTSVAMSASASTSTVRGTRHVYSARH